MKSKIFYIILLLLVSCDKGDNKLNIEKKTIKTITKEIVKKEQLTPQKYDKINAHKPKDSADKNKVTILTEGFTEDINFGLKTDDELKEYVKNAVENWDQLNLGFLMHKLKANKKYALAVIVASNLVESSETSSEYAGNLYTYALALFDNCNSDNDYILAREAIDNSINEYEKLLKKGEIIKNDDLMFMGSPYQICAGGIIKHKNNISTALEYVRKYENVMEEYNGEEKDFYTDFGVGEIYNDIAFNINEADKSVKWIYTLKDIDQIKKYANSLPEDELSPMLKILLKGRNTKIKLDSLKNSLLKAIERIEKEVTPMLEK